MAKAKRVRWECPAGEHPGQLGSSRPPADATVRFCWPCSEASGRLVKRVAPALERRRAAKTVARQARQQTARERAQEAKAAALIVPVVDRDGREFALGASELLRAAWRTPELRGQQREAWGGRLGPLPELVIRRGSVERGRAARRTMGALHPDSLPVRARDRMSGHASYEGDRIVLTVAPGLGHEWLRAIVVHEAAHAACPADARHGSVWRGAYIRAVRELYGFAPGFVPNEGPAWKLDERIADAILRDVA